MVGILVVTHGELSAGLIDAMELIMGKQQGIRSMGLYHGKDIAEFGSELEVEMKSINEGDGILVLVDLYAASPYNQAVLHYRNLQDTKCRIISGVNLPMLLELMMMRNAEMELDDLWHSCMESGKEGIREFLFEYEKFQK